MVYQNKIFSFKIKCQAKNLFRVEMGRKGGGGGGGGGGGESGGGGGGMRKRKCLATVKDRIFKRGGGGGGEGRGGSGSQYREYFTCKG